MAKKKCKITKTIEQKLEWAKLELSKGKDAIERMNINLEQTEKTVQRLSGAIMVLEELLEKGNK